MGLSMSLRIVTSRDQTATTLKVSGRLVGPWIAELARSFEAAFAQGGALVVDISDVSFVASDGVVVLRGFIRRGAGVVGCPTYLAPQVFGVMDF